MKIITNSGNQSGIELMMKYCSELTKRFGYPYYFNWSAPTNHQDTSSNGEVSDIGYAMIRCGVYPQHPTVGRFSPVEKEIMFGPVNLITNNHTPINILLSKHNINVKSWYEIEVNMDVIKLSIDRYLRELVIEETNAGIIRHNAEFNDNLPMVNEIDISSASNEQLDMITKLTLSCEKQLKDLGVSESDINDVLENGIKE